MTRVWDQYLSQRDKEHLALSPARPPAQLRGRFGPPEMFRARAGPERDSMNRVLAGKGTIRHAGSIR